MGKLTTHVLDVARGLPAAGLRLELFSLFENDKTFITNQTTNKDGRCEQPLAQGDQFPKGIYQIEFNVGDYFKSGSSKLPSFLGIVPVQFFMENIEENYHVPLIVSPYSYSTYRGS